MTTFIDNKLITLTSETASLYRNGTFLSDLNFSLPNMLIDDKNIIHKQFCLLNAQIPVSFYVINYTNDTLKFTINSTLYTILVTRGNYNANSLITELKAKILAATTETINITISKINGLLTFTHATKNFTINYLGSTINSILGLSTTSNTSSTAFSLTCSYALNLLGIKQLQIRSKSIVADNISSSLTGAGSCTLIASIPVDAPAFGLINYISNADSKCSIKNLSLDDMDLEIIDAETNQFINFNNTNWSMTFLLSVTRRSAVDTRFLGNNNLGVSPPTHELSTTQSGLQNESRFTNNSQNISTNPDLEELNFLSN